MINIDPTWLYYLGAHARYKYLCLPFIIHHSNTRGQASKTYVINVNICAQNLHELIIELYVLEYYITFLPRKK